jgi:tryptophan 2,3-dioxygenase
MSYYGDKAPLSYNKYLRVEELIKLQTTLSTPESHDELLFIITHQAYELWFKQILHELDATIKWLDDGRIFRANHSLRTVIAIEKVLVTQLEILETMAPIGFLEFRDKLNPASGFQSVQFREIEFISGLKNPDLLRFFAEDKYATERLTERLGGRTLADAFWDRVKASGLATSSNEEKSASVTEILSKPDKYADLYLLQDLLLEHDEMISIWRYRHVLMVEKMLGEKRGTGGSEGVRYLITTLNKRFFPEIWQARTNLSFN